MHAAVAVVADDLTGAADAGAGFRQAGLSTIVTWGDLDAALMSGSHRVSAIEAPRDHSPFDACVLAIDAETRALDADRARARTAAIVSALRDARVATLYKKADSTLRGHIGAEVHAALTAWHPGSLAIVAMAFPRTGRTTSGGRQHVHRVALDGPSIPGILEASGIAARHADLMCVRAADLRDTFAHHHDDGIGAVVCDAETDEDLHAIARAGARLDVPVMWVGSGGLAPALASTLSARRTQQDTAMPASSGAVLVAVGSTTAIAREQAAHLVAAGARHVVIPRAVLHGHDAGAAAAVAAELHHCLAHERVVLLTLEADVDGGVDPNDISMRLHALLQPCAPLAGALVATGGETASTILRAWGVTALRLLDEVAPGVPLSVSIGARVIPVVTKGGAFGDAGTLTRACATLERMRMRSTC